MKSFTMFLEARVGLSKLDRAANNTKTGIDSMSDADIKKMKGLFDQKSKLEKDPRAASGALAKDFNKVDKSIANISMKYSLTTDDFNKIKTM